ncbi:MAG: peroxiredoxin [Gammaproteobacteria bacterium]|nr:MAG: peroxiredoxin [Gammaproteobacteria bacterium]
MKNFIHRISLLLLKSVLFIGSAQAAELTIGQPAPDFSLLDQNFKTHTLADYQDQWLVLYFYPKNDTPGCTTEACNFRDDIIHIRALKAQVIGISLDDAKSHEAFARKYSLPFPLLADTEGTTAEAYGALWKLGPVKFAKRHSFIIGPDGLIRKIYRDVDPKLHSQQIISDLKTLIQAG